MEKVILLIVPWWTSSSITGEDSVLLMPFWEKSKFTLCLCAVCACTCAYVRMYVCLRAYHTHSSSCTQNSLPHTLTHLSSCDKIILGERAVVVRGVSARRVVRHYWVKIIPVPVRVRMGATTGLRVRTIGCCGRLIWLTMRNCISKQLH